MFDAADDALKSAATSDRASKAVDRKFGEVIDLLSGFERDFPSKESTSDPKVGGTVPREAKTSDESELSSPLNILHALKENLQSKVTFPIGFSPLTEALDADELKS